MPPKKRTAHCSITPSGKKSRLLRLTENSLQTQQRLQQQRIRQEILRTSELSNYREQRLCIDRSQHINRKQTSMRQVSIWNHLGMIQLKTIGSTPNY
ncbi:hypothetical protein AVEN_55710-1 [Araneus ventricosus]|uniref:Uncharacterized protein n=1 Tax=Araneus ventricosus TaxID=182803 RepID=A0A4Y2NBC0_ARAVE|nr:hypothetical protein AVEN_55710-1 [Araneus ventricosus]